MVFFMLLDDQESKYDRMAKKSMEKEKDETVFKIIELSITD